jgi:hypothetical protein
MSLSETLTGWPAGQGAERFAPAPAPASAEEELIQPYFGPHKEPFIRRTPYVLRRPAQV